MIKKIISIYIVLNLYQVSFSKELQLPADIAKTFISGMPEDTIIYDGTIDASGYVGKKIPPEQRTWIDDTTGYEITQWTSKSKNNHPYFTVNSFIDEETAVIYSSRTGKKQLYKLDLKTGEMTQITDVQNLKGIDHNPQFATIWYFDGKVLRALNTTSLITKEIYDFSGFPFAIGSFSVTCDAKWLVFSVNKKESKPENPGYGPFAIYRLNFETKALEQVTMDYGFNIGHVQANPTDPSLVLYCWQWEKYDRPLLVGHAPIRMWWVKLDGSDGGPITQNYGTQATHETWTQDGKFISFISKYRIGEKTGKHFLGLQTLDGKIKYEYPQQVSPGHQNLFKDNNCWITDLFNKEEPLLILFKRNDKEIEETKLLFRHNSSMNAQDSHPHPRFSPNGKYVLFSSDRTGEPQVYTVKINLQKKYGK